MKRTMLFLSSIRSYRRTNQYSSLNRRIPAYFMGFITKGRGRLIINDTIYSIEALQFFILTPGMTVSFLSESEEVDYYLLLLDVVTVNKQQQWQLSAQADLPPLLLQYGISLHKEKNIIEQLERLHRAALERIHDADDLFIQAMFQQVYGTLVQELSIVEHTQSSDESLQESIQYIHAHIQQKINLQTLSSIAKLTPTSYSRKFKQIIGETPLEYVNRIRMDEAKKRLTGGRANVKEIAAKVGFNNEFYFSKVFKETVGIAPALYIKRHQLSIATVACNSYSDSLRSLDVEPVVSVNCFRYPGMNEQEHQRNLAIHFHTLALKKPHLIIIDRYHLDMYDRLKHIAPTICLDYDLDWKVTYRKLAEILGRENKAEHVINQLEASVHQSRRKIRSTLGDGSLSLIRITPDAIRIVGSPEHPLNDLLFTELDVSAGSMTPAITSKIELSPDQLSSFSMQSDFLFIQNRFFGANGADIMTRVHSSPFWMQHEAVRHNRIRFIPNWYAMSWTPLGRQQIIETLSGIEGCQS